MVGEKRGRGKVERDREGGRKGGMKGGEVGKKRDEGSRMRGEVR
jgi:hypothetical protein